MLQVGFKNAFISLKRSNDLEAAAKFLAGVALCLLTKYIVSLKTNFVNIRGKMRGHYFYWTGNKLDRCICVVVCRFYWSIV